MTTSVDHAVQTVLRTGISISGYDGRCYAIVDLHGELCPFAAQQLRTELEQLVDDGVADITVRLQHLTFCSSHGLDVFDDIHQRLQQHHGGTLRVCLEAAPDIVRSVVHLVDDNDPTFSPQVTEAPIRL